MKIIRLVAWALVAVLVVLIGVRLLTGAPEPAKTDLGAATPGGAFTLTSHTGATVSDTDFRGRYMLVYFGYSACPDVCPLELQKLTSALLNLEEEGYDTTPIQPIFISVDPERDSPEELAGYVPQFHPRLIGLTGTPEAIAELAKGYRVYYRKVDTGSAMGYLMDHLSVIFLMGKDGQYERLFTSRDTPESIEEGLKPLLEKAS